MRPFRNIYRFLIISILGKTYKNMHLHINPDPNNIQQVPYYTNNEKMMSQSHNMRVIANVTIDIRKSL